MPQPFTSQGYRWKPVTWTQADFVVGPDNGTDANTAGDVLEFAQAEVGSDNQFSEYDAAMFGQPASDARKAGEVLFNWTIDSADSSTISDNAEINIINRSKSARDGPDITGFLSYDKLDETTVSEGVGLPRQSKVALKGTIVGIQYRDFSVASNATLSSTVSAVDTVFRIPGYGGSLLESSRRR